MDEIIEERFLRIEDSISDMKDNHFVHLKDEISELGLVVKELKTDMEWLKKFFGVVATASTGSLMAGILSLLLNH